MAATEGTSYDDFGFPTTAHSKRHENRIRIRKFTSENHWAAKYPTLDSARAALGSEPLAEIVREHGIARSYRPALWHAACLPLLASRPSYDMLLTQCASLPVDVSRQIELDLPRTFVEQRDFAAAVAAADKSHHFDGSRSSIAAAADAITADAALLKRGHGTLFDALRRMLRAFVVAHPDIGYLQSMNFIAAFVLIICGAAEEERAFDIFDAMCAHMLAGYYAPAMPSLQSDCAVFRSVASGRMPRVWAHLEVIGVGDIAALFLPRWLLCAYLNVFCADVTVRIWDCMFMEGREAPRVMVEVALALLCACDDALCTSKSFIDAAEVLKALNVRISDSAELLLMTEHATCSLRGQSIAHWRAQAASDSAGGAALSALASPVRAAARVGHDTFSPSPRVPDAAGRTPPVSIDDTLERVFSPLPASPHARGPALARRLASPLGRVLRSAHTRASPLRSPLAAAAAMPASPALEDDLPPVHAPLPDDLSSILNSSTAAAQASARKRRVRKARTTGATPSRRGAPTPSGAGVKRGRDGCTPSSLATSYTEFDADAEDVPLEPLPSAVKKARTEGSVPTPRGAPAVSAVFASASSSSSSDEEGEEEVAPLRPPSAAQPQRSLQLMMMSPRRMTAHVAGARSAATLRDRGLALGVTGAPLPAAASGGGIASATKSSARRAAPPRVNEGTPSVGV